MVRINVAQPRQPGTARPTPLRPIYVRVCPDCRNTKVMQDSHRRVRPCTRCRRVA